MPVPVDLMQAAMTASRRSFLSSFGMGMGAIGLATLLGSELRGADSSTGESPLPSGTSAALSCQGQTGVAHLRPRRSFACRHLGS